jgi:hypothetical protein
MSSRLSDVVANQGSLPYHGWERAVRRKRKSMTERIKSQMERSPLRGERGNTTISDAVVAQVAGIAAQEVEKVQMGGAPRRQSEGSCRV